MLAEYVVILQGNTMVSNPVRIWRITVRRRKNTEAVQVAKEADYVVFIGGLSKSTSSGL